MISLLAWRATCRDNYALSTDDIRGSLSRLVARFFPDPTAVMELMVPWGALVVGEAALSLILHNPNICLLTFELAVGSLYFQPFVNRLAQIISQGDCAISRLVEAAPEEFPYYRHITRIAKFCLTSGEVIVVYESITPSACDVVCAFWTTALMNFVTPHSLGCAYPRLTLNNYALQCDTRFEAMKQADHELQIRLVGHGFEFESRAHRWPVSAIEPSSTSPLTMDGCGRSMYVCPLQGRYFGDNGSFVLFYDGFSVDLDLLRDLRVAPYGPMTAWRIPSSGLCKNACIENDAVLPPFIVSMLVQFADDNSDYALSRAAVYTVADDNVRSPDVAPLLRRRDRRRSL